MIIDTAEGLDCFRLSDTVSALRSHEPMPELTEQPISCPYCGEMNIMGSNICGGCMKDIRHLANPERQDLEQTAKTRNPHSQQSWWQRLKRWWERRGRNAE